MNNYPTDRQRAISRRRIWEIIDREFGEAVEGVGLQSIACWDYTLCCEVEVCETGRSLV